MSQMEKKQNPAALPDAHIAKIIFLKKPFLSVWLSSLVGGLLPESLLAIHGKVKMDIDET